MAGESLGIGDSIVRCSKAGAVLAMTGGSMFGTAYTLDHDLTPVAAYAELASEHGWPGSDITTTDDERKDERRRASVIEVNHARPLDSFQTDSGITLEFLQPESNEYPLLVDRRAVNEALDFVIDNLSYVEQDLISPEEISGLQEKAEAGELDNVTLTIIATTDQEHCLPEEGVALEPSQGTDACHVAGRAIFRNARGVEEGWAEYNPTIIISPARQRMAEKVMPSVVPLDPENIIATTAPVAGTDAFPQDSLGSVLVHELAHAVPRIAAGGMEAEASDEQAVTESDEEHATLVVPLVTSWNTLLYAGEVATPFSWDSDSVVDSMLAPFSDD